MATLELNRVFVNLVATGAAVSAASAPGRTRGHEIGGEVRTYAGGRQRAFTVAGERTQFAFTLRMVTLATVETLRGWQGQTVQVRDHRGQRFFGTYFAIAVTEYKALVDRYDVSINLTGVTADEGV